MASDDEAKVKREAPEEGDGEPESKRAKMAPQKNADGETFFNLSKKRRLTVRKYNKKTLVDIREVSSAMPESVDYSCSFPNLYQRLF